MKAFGLRCSFASVKNDIKAMKLTLGKLQLLTPRVILLWLSIVSLVICAWAGVAHYRKAAWGDLWQPIGWLLSMSFLLLAFLPRPPEMAAGLKKLVKPKTGFFLFWILFFIASHLWNFRTAPWNGNGLFDDSAVDLLYLKNYVIGHPFQPAWFHERPFPYFISRETLFHYYVWGFLQLFGFNILSYEAALLVLWCLAFIFALLIVHLFFQSYIVTSIAALTFNFLVFSFLYTFVGYRYPMTVALCVGSLYFLYLGFSEGAGSPLYLCLGGIAAGLCLASSIVGKQYLLALVFSGVLYAGVHWKTVRQRIKWSSISIVIYGLVAAATPILCYIAFNRQAYTYYEGAFIRRFWEAMRGHPPPNDMRFYVTQLRDFFFTTPGPRLFFPDALPIPSPYYAFLVPGVILAVWQKRYEIALLAMLPVAAVFISAGGTTEHRMLLAIPFWIILMGFAFAALLRLQLPLGFKVILFGVAGSMLATGLVPSVQYIYGKTKDPSTIGYFAQEQVAVSRFLRNVVAGKEPPNPPHLERDEFNRVERIPNARYDTLICQSEAYSIIHLFLHDYDDIRILSFCGGTPASLMIQQDVWSHNRKAILDYVPKGKDLKLIWESDSKTERIVEILRRLRDTASQESISCSFAGRQRTFHVLNIASSDIGEFQGRVRALPDSLP
jgi:hypothetical protein